MRLRYGALGIVGAWAVTATVVAPEVIRRGYREESLDFINDAFTGRTVHPLDFYLEAWTTLSILASVALLVLFGLTFLGLRHPKVRKKVVAWTVAGDPGLDIRTTVWLGATLGLTAGLSEAVFRAIRQWATHRPAARFHIELMWMAPVSATVGMLLVTAGLIALARVGDTRVGVWKVTMLMGFLTIYGVMQSEGIPIHPWAEVVLSIGLTTVVARSITSRPETLERLILRARPIVVGVFGVLALFAFYNLPSVAERRSLRGRTAAGSDLPNILLVILDTVRSSNLSLYGYGRETTPNLDAWAESGVVFERAYTTAPWTLPSHASMFTGYHNFRNRTSWNAPLDETYPTLAEVLAGEGYHTGGFVANLWYTTRMSGLQRGFDRYQDELLNPGQVMSSSWLGRTMVSPAEALTMLLSRTPKTGIHVTEEFLAWLERPREGPFFAFLNYFDAHHPYRSQEPYGSRFGQGPVASWEETRARWRADTDPSVLEPWVNRYDGAIAFMDHQLGRIFDSLERHQLLDNTIVVVTSDHGEMWGEHGYISHGNSLYLPLVRAPLVVSFPGRVPGNLRLDDDVSLVDLPATLIELAGLSTVSPIPGVPFGPTVSAPAVPDGASVPFAELLGSDFRDETFTETSNRDLLSVFEGRWHYILRGGDEEELYDMDADPGELTDLARSPAAEVQLAHLRATVDSVRR